jgi:uncharacterized protein (DUF362 family)
MSNDLISPGNHAVSTCQQRQVGLAFGRPEAGDWASAYRDAGEIARCVGEAVARSGLGSGDPSRPFEGLVRAGQSVMLKPNWVYHRNGSGQGMQCMITQHEVLLACLRHVLRERPSAVLVGDAPIQACDWDGIVTAELLRQIDELARESRIPVKIVDFRRTIVSAEGLAGDIRTNVRSQELYAPFDLGCDSLLEPISSEDDRFRVTCYDHRELAKTHRPGRHQYLICRQAFECDIVISLPKLKTHRKAGLTGALKNLVGINGSKEYLPHHRLGGTSDKGDCYPGASYLRKLAEFFYDTANQRIGKKAYDIWTLLGAAAGHFVTDKEGGMEGSWHGNDTCWRMVLDLNRILRYGRKDGTMGSSPQRAVYSLTDAIVCGQGEGPLRPEPLRLNAVTFCDSSPDADAVHATLLGLDYRSIPLIRESFGQFRWPLVEAQPRPITAMTDHSLNLDELAHLAVPARAPEGWAGHIELNRTKA